MLVAIIIVVVAQFQSIYVLTQQPDSQSQSSTQYIQQAHVSVDKETIKYQGDKIGLANTRHAMLSAKWALHEAGTKQVKRSM